MLLKEAFHRENQLQPAPNEIKTAFGKKKSVCFTWPAKLYQKLLFGSLHQSPFLLTTLYVFWYSCADSLHCSWKQQPLCFFLSLAHREEGYWTTATPSSSSSFCSPSLRLPSCNASSSASSSTRPTWQLPAVVSCTSPFTYRTSSASPGKTASPRTLRSWWWVSQRSVSL